MAIAVGPRLRGGVVEIVVGESGSGAGFVAGTSSSSSSDSSALGARRGRLRPGATGFAVDTDFAGALASLRQATGLGGDRYRRPRRIGSAGASGSATVKSASHFGQ
ncbi:MAG: hypothetical protein U0792_25760 [Gemmataceae bacterium]